MPWTEDDDALMGGGFETAEVRSPWRRLIDSFIEGALHSPLGAEGVVRATTNLSAEELNRRERALSDRLARKRERDEEAFKNTDTLSPANIGKNAVDLVGGIFGSVDPTWLLNPGRGIATKVASQAGINAAVDAGGQALEVNRGVRDEYDPLQTGINAAAGGALVGGIELGSRYRTGRRVARGTKVPGWKEVNDIIVRDLEGGGTLANPKVSPKGAMGPQQVMPETARDPGFGIRPWDGKSQSDLARVGRQYSAAMMDKYDGNVAKVFAAYNAGPGRVDKLIKKYGDDWMNHLPDETQKYVKKGMLKLGLGDIPFVGREARVKEQGRRMARMNADELEAQFSRDQQNINGLISDIENIQRSVDDALRQADDSDPVVDFAPPLDSSHEKFTPYVDRPNDPANDVTNFKNHLDPELDDLLQRGQIIRQMRDDVSDKARKGELTHEQWEAEFDRLDAMEMQRAKDIEKLRLQRGMPSREDVLTPAERQEMDASAVRPEIAPTTPKGLGKGSVATTPVNDLLGESEDDFINRVMKPGYKMTPEEEARIYSILNDASPEERARGRDIANEYLTSKNPEANLVSIKDFLKTLKDIIDNDEGSFRPFGRDAGPDEPRDPYAGLTPEEKLTKAVKAARPLSAEQRRLYHEERSRRASSLSNLQREGGGLEGYQRELASQRGELPKADYESIAHHFTDEDINSLLNQIKLTPTLLPYEKLNTQTALLKLLGAEGAKAPTAGEIRLLSEAFPEEFITALLNNRSTMEKVWHGIKSGLNLPRALMSSFDLSAPFRQGIFMVGRKEFWKSFANMFKLVGSEDASKALMQEIKTRPTWELMKKAGLAITDPHSHILMDREEDFMSDWAESKVAKKLLVGHGVAASNRAYSGFLNKLRADVFDDLVRKYEDAGVDLKRDPKKLRDIATYVNAGTGRGNLGKTGNKAAPFLNGLFFSPRLIASRLQMLNPVTYMKLDPIVRKEAVKSLMSFGAIALTAGGLAKYALGADVETDPRSPDFFKVKIGNTRYDILGGFQQYIRLGAQLATGEKITGRGEVDDLTDGNFGGDTRRDVLIRFGINKLSPVASFVSDALEGKDPTGKEFDLTNSLAERFIPMFISDVADAYEEEGAKGIAKAAPGVFGIGAQTYPPPPPRKKSGRKEKSIEEEFSDLPTDLEEDFDVSEWDF